MSEPNEMTCGELAGVAAELALGVLTGRERALAVAHLDKCDACREDVRQLMATGEQLLELLPSAEPPAGFETRVLERMELPVPGVRTAGPRGTRRPWRARRTLAAAAVCLAVVAAGLGGWRIGAATSPNGQAAAPLTSVSLFSAADQRVGNIFLYAGTPRWLFMSVDLGGGDESVRCQVVAANGRVTTIGTFRLAGGYGAWGSPAPENAGTLSGARLVSADGTILATATFAGW